MLATSNTAEDRERERGGGARRYRVASRGRERAPVMVCKRQDTYFLRRGSMLRFKSSAGVLPLAFALEQDLNNSLMRLKSSAGVIALALALEQDLKNSRKL